MLINEPGLIINNNNLFCNIKCNVILHMDRLRILIFPIKIMSYSIVMVAGGITLFILLFIISFSLMILKAKLFLISGTKVEYRDKNPRFLVQKI